MKNSFLLLLLSLSTQLTCAQPEARHTHINAEKTFEQSLDERIQKLNLGLSKKETRGIAAFTKKNPVLTGVIVATLLGMSTAGGLYAARNTTYGKAINDFIASHGGTTVYNHGQSVLAKAQEKLNTAQKNPVITGSVIVGVIALALATYNRQELYALYKKNFNKNTSNTTDKTAEPQSVVNSTENATA